VGAAWLRDRKKATDRTTALFIEILGRNLSLTSNMMVALLCVVIILTPLAALLLLAFNLTLGGYMAVKKEMPGSFHSSYRSSRLPNLGQA